MTTTISETGSHTKSLWCIQCGKTVELPMWFSDTGRECTCGAALLLTAAPDVVSSHYIVCMRVANKEFEDALHWVDVGNVHQAGLAARMGWRSLLKTT